MQVPLSAFARFEPTSTPLAVNHQGLFAASTISFNLPVGVSLSDATKVIDDAMARIGVPTLVVAGRKDRTVPYRDQELAARSIPGARLITFYDTGHVVPEERPEAFAAVLADFLDGLDAPGA